ncbi:MAG: GGDEF domain-containing protein [Ruminococcus sp.]|nr:GGDEF domain-containing protein [Ruminococcus sp.]
MKNNVDFIMDTYFSDFVKVIKVNNNTGEFQFLRKCPLEEDPDKLGIKTIDAYAEQIVAKQMRTPDAAENIIFHSKSAFLKQLQKSGETKSVHTDIYHIGDQYLWLTCRISIPKDFSKENPWYLITWKPTDSETESMAESMVIFATSFYKILKVNLTLDTYEIIKVKDDELNHAVVHTKHITDWWRIFADQGYVHAEDRANYDCFTEMDEMQKELRHGTKFLRCRYRRKTNAQFCWVSMEIIPALEYTDDNQIVMLYIRDINDDYINEVMHQQELEHYCYHDGATGLRNRLYYNRLCDKYSDGCENSVGIIFADLNRLKYINDTYGHTEGDRYIQDFAQLLANRFELEHSYRISDDEFMVILQNISEKDFQIQADQLHDTIQKMDVSVATMGCAYENAEKKRLEDIVQQAEQRMYEDKEHFYQIYSAYGRKKMTFICDDIANIPKFKS